MDEMRTLKRSLVGLGLWSASVVGLSVSTSDEAPAPPDPLTAVTGPPAAEAPPTSASPYTAVVPAPARSVSSGSVLDHDSLQRDAEMTQRMSAPNASGPMFTGQARDPQLDHSQDPAFLRALEEHQAEIDQMLARPRS